MKFNSNVFDLWVFGQDEDIIKYLLLYSSQEKADTWFGGVRFWQILSDFFQEDEGIIDGASRLLSKYNFNLLSLWAVEHSYIFYNRRYKEIQLCTIFAAEVKIPDKIQLSLGHSDYAWFSADECLERIRYRGLKEGLEWLHRHITETTEPLKELKLM